MNMLYTKEQNQKLGWVKIAIITSTPTTTTVTIEIK